jgi:hypothetical protein
MRQAVASAGRNSVIVGTPAEYGPGIEFGRHPGGKLARRAGGSFALTDALDAIRADAPGVVRGYLMAGRTVMQALWALGNQVLAYTRVNLTERVYSQPIPTTRSGKPKWKRMDHLRESYTVQQGGTAGGLRGLYRGGS